MKKSLIQKIYSFASQIYASCFKLLKHYFEFVVFKVFVVFLFFSFGCNKSIEMQDTRFSEENRGDVKKKSFRQCAAFSLSIDLFDTEWLKFVSESQNEMADYSDFHFSEEVLQKENIRVDVETWTSCPVITGYFNGDENEDFMVITVDKRIPTSDKYSLIIFSSEKTNKGDNKFVLIPKELYKNTDLSKTLISKSRSGLWVRSYDDTGLIRNCNVKWNETKNGYTCHSNKIN